ncbi:MAG TPA: SDR family oxidoreductase [Pyrinomonadaceae bacterium]|nr:SDR family oxidoreductase [Pyrinomonadaceae bacterium]
MKLLVIGATRGIGLEVVQKALEAGHEVTALARSPQNFSVQHEKLRVVKGDILDQSSIERALEGQDVVCVTIGIGLTRKPVSIFSEGTRKVVEAMKKSQCRRLVCVTGIGAGDSRGHGGFLYDKIFAPLFLKTIYEDKDRQERIVRESGLDWVIVRPGFLTNGPRTGKYRALTELGGVKSGKISRADVADFIVKEAADMKFRGKTPLLTY